MILLGLVRTLNNFTSLSRELYIGTNPWRGNTTQQNFALADLEQLQPHDWTFLTEFSTDYTSLASKTGSFFYEEIGNKYLRKPPGQLGSEIELGWQQSTVNQIGLGVGPRIRYTHDNSQAAIQSTLKKQDFGFCKNIIYAPQEYRESRKLKKKNTKILKKHEKLPRKIIEK